MDYLAKKYLRNTLIALELLDSLGFSDAPQSLIDHTEKLLESLLDHAAATQEVVH